MDGALQMSRIKELKTEENLAQFLLQQTNKERQVTMHYVADRFAVGLVSVECELPLPIALPSILDYDMDPLAAFVDSLAILANAIALKAATQAAQKVWMISPGSPSHVQRTCTMQRTKSR